MDLDEFSKDTEHLCTEIGKFLNKWKGKLFKPLEKTLELIEMWLGKKEENKLACPLGDSTEVLPRTIEFLKHHNYIDVFEKGEYLFTLEKLEKETDE